VDPVCVNNRMCNQGFEVTSLALLVTLNGMT
jgi:hypothetical protein